VRSKEYWREYRKKNRERVAICDKKRQLKNKEIIAVRKAVYYLKNKDSIL